MNIQKSEALADWIDSKIRNLEIPSERVRLSVSCFDMVREHHRGIVLLVANRLYGSAFALARPIYEALVRGLWIWQCATDEQIQKIIKKDEIKPSFRELVENIEEKENPKIVGQVLNEVRKRHWKSLSSLTHTGWLQIERRNTKEHIESNYDENEIEHIVGFADALALLAVLMLAGPGLAGNNDLAEEIGEKIRQYFGQT